MEFIRPGDMHSHLEGSVWPEDVYAALKDVGVSFQEKTKSFIDQTYERDASKSTLLVFISKLSTRWIRLGLLSVYKAYETQPNLIKEKAKEYLHSIVRRMIYRANNQGLGYFNMLYSPMNMAVDPRRGDLSKEKFSVLRKQISGRDGQNPMPEEEKELYTWFESKIHGDQFGEYLTVQDYLDIVNDEIKKWHNTQPREKMPVVIQTLSFRRDSDLTLIKNGSAELAETLDFVTEAFKSGQIDCIDICGNEADERFELRSYTQFFYELESCGVPYTLHLGELPDTIDGMKIVQENFRVFFDLHPLAIAHGVRLTDDTPWAKLARLHMEKEQIAWIICLTSNESTGTVSVIHNIAVFMKQALHMKIPKCFGVDDAVVFAPVSGGVPVMNEMTWFAQQLIDVGVNAHAVELLRDQLVAQSHQTFQGFYEKIRIMREVIKKKEVK